MSPAELAVLTLILSAFVVFIATLAWASRQPRTIVKAAKRKVHRGALRPQRGLTAVHAAHCERPQSGPMVGASSSTLPNGF